MIEPWRIKELNHKPVVSGKPFVVYWMQSSQRTVCNHALEFAVELANDAGCAPLVCLGLTEQYPEANERHFQFMLEGLADVKEELGQRGIAFLVVKDDPARAILHLSDHAAAVVVDRGYMRHERMWRSTAAAQASSRVVQVETNVVVPLEMVSGKAEYSAATLRRKLLPLIDTCSAIPDEVSCHHTSNDRSLPMESFFSGDAVTTLAGLSVDRSVRPSPVFRGGQREATRRLADFADNRLACYDARHSDPAADCTSKLSPYLHFGQISPLQVLAMVKNCDPALSASFVEELVVRRELACNHALFNPAYDSVDGLPAWARSSLYEHESDRREFVYSYDQFANAATHDPYWNAAQNEMVHTGHMHGYMRMYWGKKILEWSPTVGEAFRTALKLNNTFEIDGRDPNGCTGVAWCFGLHDRPWAERPVFGLVRYMNAKGLERKFDIRDYVRRVQGMGEDAGI